MCFLLHEYRSALEVYSSYSNLKHSIQRTPCSPFELSLSQTFPRRYSGKVWWLWAMSTWPVSLSKNSPFCIFLKRNYCARFGRREWSRNHFFSLYPIANIGSHWRCDSGLGCYGSIFPWILLQHLGLLGQVCVLSSVMKYPASAGHPYQGQRQ